MGGRFDIKCDQCKNLIGRTDNPIISAQGGTCRNCKFENMSRGTLKGL